MKYDSIASRIARKNPQVIPDTRYVCRADLSIHADFIGSTSKSSLTKALKRELTIAVKSALTNISRGFQLEPSDISVQADVKCVERK